MSNVFTSFKNLKLPIRIKIPITLLQIVYICMTGIIFKFDFMNYLFAYLLVWPYDLCQGAADQTADTVDAQPGFENASPILNILLLMCHILFISV